MLGSVNNAPLAAVAVSDQFVFASTRIRLSTEVGGLWRVPKAGGKTELYADLRYAEEMAVVGDKLYFVVHDDPAGNGTGGTGGLYSCPLAGAAPFAPTLVAAATNPGTLAVDKGSVFYGDGAASKGLMKFDPMAGAPPSVFRAGYGFGSSLFVDGTAAFYAVTIFSTPQRAKVLEILPDGGVSETYFYQSAEADTGQLIGNPTSLLFAAYDFMGTTGGVVRRLSRNGGISCDIGGSGNKRPYGVHEDGARVYWTNQGEGPEMPYTKGSVASCAQASCCTTTTPDVMWSGDGQPAALTGDAEAVYFVTYASGLVTKIAKP